MLLLVKSYLFVTLNYFTVLQSSIGIASGPHGTRCLGRLSEPLLPVVPGMVVSGSGSGQGLWLLDLSLGVHGSDDEVAWLAEAPLCV